MSTHNIGCAQTGISLNSKYGPLWYGSDYNTDPCENSPHSGNGNVDQLPCISLDSYQYHVQVFSRHTRNMGKHFESLWGPETVKEKRHESPGRGAKATQQGL